MELLSVTLQVSEELLRLFRLVIVLLFFVDDVLEVVVACLAVPLSVISINARVVVGVPTHEVNRW
jgi:hypothetical protein